MNTKNETMTQEEQEQTLKQHEHSEHVHGPNCNHHHHSLAPIIRQAPKIGRNDLCLCGSQKKYKKCCGQ